MKTRAENMILLVGFLENPKTLVRNLTWWRGKGRWFGWIIQWQMVVQTLLSLVLHLYGYLLPSREISTVHTKLTIKKRFVHWIESTSCWFFWIGPRVSNEKDLEPSLPAKAWRNVLRLGQVGDRGGEEREERSGEAWRVKDRRGEERRGEDRSE